MRRSDALDRLPRVTQVRMALEWYIDAGGRVDGPVPADELRARAADGRLAPTDSVSTDRVTWVPANTVPDLTFPPRPRQPLLETVVAGSAHSAPAPESGPDVVPVVTVKGYEILDTLGAGACGVVYKARQENLNRVLALKTVLMPDRATPELLGRFQKEAVSLAKLHHPNIVAVYDSGMCEKPGGQAYFAMELLDGEDLGARIDRAGPLPESVVWPIARQTAAALAHAAKNKIIHRDVKPANLFLVPPPTGFPLPDGVPMVKVTDFGLALSRAEGDQRQSVAGTVLGTPVYMAPEQFAGSDVDERADIYGLGCTVYHALTGAPPFDGRTVWDVMMKKSAPPPRLAPPISPETADLVASMLAIAPDDRPRDYTELLARIDALPCVDPGTGSLRLSAPSGRIPAVPDRPAEPAGRAPAPAPRRRWVSAVAVAVLVGACVGIAALAGAFNSSSDPPAAGPVEPDRWVGPFPLPPPPPAPPKPRGEHLHRVGSIVGWALDGGSWSIEPDEENGKALTVSGTAVRKFDPPPNFSVSLCLHPNQARVDVVIATGDGPPGAETRWLIRFDRAPKRAKTVAFGKQVGPGGKFEPVGPALPVPTPDELIERKKSQYLETKYERRDGKLVVSFQGQPLGSTPDAGLRTVELRLESTGPIRLGAADLTEIVPPKRP